MVHVETYDLACGDVCIALASVHCVCLSSFVVIS